MQQLRGKEGARVRRIYSECSREYGVPWAKRQYDPENFTTGDPINQALSAAHTCLYGLCHAVIVALGCSPGLGFVHTGHDRAFVYDVADLYKADVTIPIAFKTVSDLETEDALSTATLTTIVRQSVRDSFRTSRLVDRVATDVKRLLVGEESEPEEEFWADVIQLWGDRDTTLAGGQNYS